MEIFPTYAKLLHDGYRRRRESAVLRTEMETGPAQQAKVRARGLVTHQVQYAFGSIADYQNFLTWFFVSVAAGAAWFTWPDPMTDAALTARIAGGVIEEEIPNKTLDVWVLRFKIEHWD